MIEKIFISHSTKDRNIVGTLIDLIEAMGFPQEKIFCSSFEGYGIKLGEDFLLRIKKELSSKTLILFVLTNNFYESKICLCEMGAAWIKTQKHIPILIPPLDFKDIEGVIPLTQGFKINDREKLNSFRDIVIQTFSLKDININTWERKRDTFIKNINSALSAHYCDTGKKSIDYYTISSEGKSITIKVGDEVLHSKFGEGEVLRLKPDGSVDINFKNCGRKTLSIGYANLKILQHNQDE